MRQQPLTLESVLAYDHAGVRSRSEKQYLLNEQSSRDVFRELLKWLWLNAVHESLGQNSTPVDFPPYLSIRIEQLVIDEMWHFFLQYTNDYDDFCKKYLGGWIGHAPNDAPDAVDQKLNEDYLQKYLKFVAEMLGISTVKKWFRTYAVEYSQTKLLKLQRDALNQKIEALEQEHDKG